MGYIHGGKSPTSVNTILSNNYQIDAITLIASTLITARDSGAGVGIRTQGYIAGGQNLGVPTTSINKIVHATETVSLIAGVLTANAVGRGSANASTKGFVVHSDATSTLDKITYATDTVASSTNFGVANIQAGCNGGDSGVFGSATGALYKLTMSVETVAGMAGLLSSTTGLSASFNSLSKGYFAGKQWVDSVDFSTGTITLVNQLVTSNAQVASSATYQSMGLI